MNLLITTDYVFVRSGGGLYSVIAWKAEDFASFGAAPGVIRIVGRIKTAASQPSSWHRVDERRFEIVEALRFNSFWELASPLAWFTGARRMKAHLGWADAIFAKLFYFNSVLAVFLAPARVPIVSLLVGDAAASASLRKDVIGLGAMRRMMSAFVAHITRRIQARVTLAGYVAEFLRAKYHASTNPAVVVHESGLEPEMLQASEKNFDSRPLRIAYVGRLAPAKGCRDLLDATALLVKAGCDVTVRLVGDGPDRPRLEAQVESRKLSRVVTFAGWLASDSRELRAEFDAAHVLALPSYSEGLPLVVVEGFAARVAIVASDLPGTRELIQHGVNGLLFPPGSVDGLARCLRELAADPARAAQLAEAGFAASRQHLKAVQQGRWAAAIRSATSSTHEAVRA